MTKINHYEISNNGKLSVETNNTSVTLLPESLEELEVNNTFSITIVAYNSEGMSSQPTSKSFGMNIHTVHSSYVFSNFILVSYVLLLCTYALVYILLVSTVHGTYH